MVGALWLRLGEEQNQRKQVVLKRGDSRRRQGRPPSGFFKITVSFKEPQTGERSKSGWFEGATAEQTGEAGVFQRLQLDEARTEQRLLTGADTSVQHVQVCVPLNVTMREPKRDKNQRDEPNGSIQVLSASVELIKSFE